MTKEEILEGTDGYKSPQEAVAPFSVHRVNTGKEAGGGRCKL